MSETQLNDRNVESGPWYKYPWVWFVACVPFTAVLFGIVMISSTGVHRDDLVVDDYYKEGMGINRLLEQDEAAIELGISIELYAVNEHGLQLSISGEVSSPVLFLYHITSQDQDLEVPLQFAGNGMYVANSGLLGQRFQEPGVWYMEVRDAVDGWRIRQRVVTPVTEMGTDVDE